MQVSGPVRPPTPRPQRDPSRETFVAGLVLSVTAPATPLRLRPPDFSQQLQAERQQRLERREALQRRRDASPARVLEQRERAMWPASRAFRQELRREQARATPAAQPSAPDAETHAPASTASRSPAVAVPADQNASVGANPSRPALPQKTVTAGPQPAASEPSIGHASGRSPALSLPAQTMATDALPQIRSMGAAEVQGMSSGMARPVAEAGTAARGSVAQGGPRIEPGGAVDVASRTPRGPGAAGRKLADSIGRGDSEAQERRRIERIVRVVRHSLRHGITRTTLRLDAPLIGKLRIDMELQGSALNLRFEPTHELAHRLLNREADQLAAALRQAGLDPQRIEIRPAGQADGQPAFAGGHGDQGGSRPGQHAGTSGGRAHDGPVRPAVLEVPVMPDVTEPQWPDARSTGMNLWA